MLFHYYQLFINVIRNTKLKEENKVIKKFTI